MLTGLVEPDKGDVLYEGISFYGNIEEARTKIGLCSQHDVLYSKLTVKEHLKLIGVLRNIPSNELDSAINEALGKMNLTDQQGKFSDNLSGGNKRKLCLAMAVIGSVKVLLLDEPTSGMDPQNRRIIWQHIRELKASGLTILMTTHHLDEAEELADRVAIMSKGKLLALGSSDFIKRNFGEGYYLTITPNFSNETAIGNLDPYRNEIDSTIMKIIEGAKKDEQTAPDVIKYLLPFKSQKRYPELFFELERNRNIKFSLQMNSLEDTFINIGLKEDEFLGNENTENIKIETQPPSSFSKPPVFNFFKQLWVIFKRKGYVMFRSVRNIILVLLPAVILLIGISSKKVSKIG